MWWHVGGQVMCPGPIPRPSHGGKCPPALVVGCCVWCGSLGPWVARGAVAVAWCCVAGPADPCWIGRRLCVPCWVLLVASRGVSCARVAGCVFGRSEVRRQTSGPLVRSGCASAVWLGPAAGHGRLGTPRGRPYSSVSLCRRPGEGSVVVQAGGSPTVPCCGSPGWVCCGACLCLAGVRGRRRAGVRMWVWARVCGFVARA